jgi:hypothetical protein
MNFIKMIPLAMTEEAPTAIYGAVTIGSVWIFGFLDSATITQDIASYAIPDDLETLVKILVGILEP